MGFSHEKEFRGCAQCTVAAIQDALGIVNDDVFRAASGLATGGGLTSDGSCGGVIGGGMMISLLFGRRREFFDGDDKNKYTAFRLVKELQQRFLDTYGSVICRDIHEHLFGRSYDLWDPDEKQQFNDAGAHCDKCTSVVAQAAAWSVELILEEEERRKASQGD